MKDQQYLTPFIADQQFLGVIQSDMEIFHTSFCKFAIGMAVNRRHLRYFSYGQGFHQTWNPIHTGMIPTTCTLN